jgi:hypothetical protein
MADNPTNPAGQEEGPLYAPESGFSLFIKLFIVPALIVAFALGIFLLGTIALQHPKTAEQYLEDFKSDSTVRRWQSAYELSRMLNQGEKIQFNDALRAELVKAFVDAKTDDPKVREYLALVLGSLKEKTAVPALCEATQDSSINLKVNSLWALGNIEDPAGGPAALQALSDSDPGVQLMAVGTLSSLRYAPAKSALENDLGSSNKAMRYDAAVALARLGDDKAVLTLMEMMNLQVTGQPNDDQMIEASKLAAVEVVEGLHNADLHAKLLDLSKNDPDLKVRAAALDQLKK